MTWSIASRPRVVAFIHSYMPGGKLDTFMEGLVAGFVDVGVDIHLVMANDLVASLGENRLKPDIDERRILEFVDRVAPDFIISTNRAGIGPGVRDSACCPILNWMVDTFPFMHHGGGHDDLFGKYDYAIVSATRNIENTIRSYPILKDRVFYLPFATNVAEFGEARGTLKDINVSFVGTYFYAELFTRILSTYSSVPQIFSGLLRFAAEVEESFAMDERKAVRAFGLERVLKDFNLGAPEFKAIVSNCISLNQRIAVLDAVAPVGLKLYGTENWINVNQFSLRLLSCFQSAVPVDTREKLIGIYERSKVSLNISHAQAMGGLPYRIFDIMASSSMLLADKDSALDLRHLFGEHMPIPLYESPAHARELSREYIDNERRRSEVVRACNALVSSGFSFGDRVGDMYAFLGLRRPERERSGRGKLFRVDARRFVSDGRVYSLSGTGSSHGTQASGGGAASSSAGSTAVAWRPKPLLWRLSARALVVANRLWVRFPPPTRMTIKRFARTVVPDRLKRRIRSSINSLSTPG